MRSALLVTTTLAAWALGPPLSGEPVALRLEPSMTAPEVRSIDSSDEQLSRAEPVLEAGKRNEGWKWMEFTGTFRGFVPLESVGKDLSIAPDTLVYLRASEASPVLTTINEDDTVDLIWASDWAEIEFTKAVPVYFRTAAQPLPEITFDGTSGAPAAVRPTAGAEATARTVEPGAPILDRYLDGILATTGKPRGMEVKYPLQLVDRKGKRLAYVDASRIRISASMERYLNRQVTIFGAVTVLKKSGAILIEARTIRYKR